MHAKCVCFLETLLQSDCVVLLFRVGQVVKDVVDKERCRHVFPGDVLVAINDVLVRDWPHDDVVNVLRSCRPRRVARLAFTRPDSIRHDATTCDSVPTAWRPTDSDPAPRVDYNQLYLRMYSPVPFSRGGPESTLTRSPAARRSAANGGSDARYSAPPDVVGGSPGPRRLGPGRRRDPRRSLPAVSGSVDLLSPLAPRREPSTSSLNFSGTPDFIPASAYIDDDRRRTGDLAVGTGVRARDEVFTPSATNTPLLGARDNSFRSTDTDTTSSPSADGPPTTSGLHDRRTPIGFAGTGNETCNGYNARTETLYSAPVRHHPSPAVPRLRTAELVGSLGKGLQAAERQRTTTTVTDTAELLERCDIKESTAPFSVIELAKEPSPGRHNTPDIQVSLPADILLLSYCFYQEYVSIILEIEILQGLKASL